MEIENELEPMKKIVGGFIQMVQVLDWNMVCNEEGKLDGLPPNRYIDELKDVIAGTFFLSSAVDDEGEFTSLTQEEVGTIISVFSAQRIYS
jgi:hypothetical protein